MRKDSNIYIAGHTGFVGSAIMRNLRKRGYKNLLLRTKKQLDLTDQYKTNIFFKKYKPEYVFLFAARVGGIYANNTYSAEFIYQNIMIQSNVVEASFKNGVKKMLFPGSACIYPKYCSQSIKPEHLLTGAIEPTNEPFAVSKICGIKMCEAYNRQYNTNFISIVPATVYGPGDHFDKNGHVIAGLIQRFHDAKIKSNKNLTIWGSGKPKREFIYVDDVANACIFLIKKYNGKELINIGTGDEISIKNLAFKIKKKLGIDAKIICDISKPDGIPRRKLDSTKLFNMGWRPKINLDKGLELTYKYFREEFDI